jgi:hypothetical protein
MKKSVFKWQEWVLDANVAYTSCCKRKAPKPPKLPATDCTDKDECKDVYDLFQKWAEDITRWAKALTKAVNECFDTWEPKVYVPDVPGERVKCDKVCQAIKNFHVKLAAWGEDVRYPLNEICTSPGPGLVPKPPPPPF